MESRVGSLMLSAFSCMMDGKQTGINKLRGIRGGGERMAVLAAAEWLRDKGEELRLMMLTLQA